MSAASYYYRQEMVLIKGVEEECLLKKMHCRGQNNPSCALKNNLRCRHCYSALSNYANEVMIYVPYYHFISNEKLVKMRQSHQLRQEGKTALSLLFFSHFTIKQQIDGI